ncbi:MAG: hypothetical protein Q9172_004170 [Xanthocarpia lactea]
MALETYYGAMEYLVQAKPYLQDLEHALSEEHRAFAFLYCNYKERAQQTFQNLISSLIRQLIHHSRTIPSELRRLYQRSLDLQIRPSRQELLGLLTTVGSKFYSLYIVIDALDECDDTEGVRSCLFSILCEALPRACFLVTSRLVPDIEDQFKNRPRLEIKATDEDIRLYVSDQILRKPTLKRHIKADPNLGALMIETIGRKSDGMNALRCALKSLPTELDNTYDEALQRIRDQKEESASLAEDVLMWVVFAVVPLEIVQLQHAIASMSLDGQTDIGDEDLTEPGTLLDVCGGIVVVDKESTIVRLVHYTTQEYFDRHPLRLLPVAQGRITKSCITYLLLAPFNCGDSSSYFVLRDWHRRYPFVYYAALHWGKHARGVPEDDCRAQILELVSKENIRAITVYVTDYQTGSFHGRLGGLAYAAALGLTSIVNHIVNEGVDVNQINSIGITALMSAAGAGYVDTVRALLAAGADVDQRSKDDITALMIAASNGHDEVVQILLDHKANIEAATFYRGETSLLRAAKKGFTSTVQLLVDKGADMNAGDGLLHAAIEGGSTAMVELAANKIGELLTKADHMENTLVQFLELGGPIASFELLIEKWADPTGSKYGVRPIHVAARDGNVEAVRSLLKHGVSPNIRDEDGDTPIHRAAFSRNHKMIQILVDHGADLTAQNDAGESVLHIFTRSEFDNNWVSHFVDNNLMSPLVPLLVRCGVPVNTPDAEGKTALHIAVHRGFACIVKFLMEHGADGSRKDHGGRTPLEIAAISGNEKLVEQMLGHLAIPSPTHLTRLLAGARLRNAVEENNTACIQKILKEPDVDVNIPEVSGWTALHFGAYYGKSDIVESLLERGALVNARGADPARTDYNKMSYAGSNRAWDSSSVKIRYSSIANFRATPLHEAAGRGHTDVVEILLKHGADLDATDNYGNKAFYRAVEEGHANVIKLLLERGSQVSESPEGCHTPLSASVSHAHEDVVRLLLENGADAERNTDWGKSALEEAMENGNHEIAELLRKHGFTTPEE